MTIETQIELQFQQAKKLLIISHRKPDGDTVGAATAIYLHLQNLGKDVNLFCVNQVPENLKFLKGGEAYRNDANALNLNDYDTIITCDCGDLGQTGISDKLMAKPKSFCFINIDHHLTNNDFGDLNLVKAGASSTSEIIYNLFQTLKIKLNRDLTNALLTGILTDTTYFSNGATNINAVSAASDLLIQGANLKQISDKLLRNKNIQILRLWGRILSQLKFNTERKIAVAVISEEDLKTANVSPDAIEGISNFLNNLYDADITMVLTQLDANTIKGSLRTTTDEINVADFAKLLGGGGHKKAAGFTISGKLVKNENTWRIV